MRPRATVENTVVQRGHGCRSFFRCCAVPGTGAQRRPCVHHAHSQRQCPAPAPALHHARSQRQRPAPAPALRRARSQLIAPPAPGAVSPPRVQPATAPNAGALSPPRAASSRRPAPQPAHSTSASAGNMSRKRVQAAHLPGFWPTNWGRRRQGASLSIISLSHHISTISHIIYI